MDRDQLLAEIKKMLQEELKNYTQPLADKIPDEHKAQALELKDDVNGFVKSNPWMAVGIAVFVGYLAGKLLSGGREE